MKRWIVRLEGEERRRLEQMVGSGKATAYKVRHANVLLAVDESPGGRHRTDGEVAQTLGMSSLYEAFEPSEARRLIEKIEPVHTPKHGSWLNMAECELSVLEKQALGDHVPTEADLARRVRLWNDDRNHRTKRIDWQFRTSDARVKLRRLYPKTHTDPTI